MLGESSSSKEILELGGDDIVGEYPTKCGGLLVVTSRVLPHLHAHPEVTKELFVDAVSRVVLPQTKKFVAEVDLGRVIGKGSLIPAPSIETDTVAKFAYRKGRRTASRVIPVPYDGTLPDITTFTIFAHLGENELETDKRRYYLRTCYIGKAVQREPGDAALRVDSKEEGLAIAFWCQHALLHDSELMGPIFESTWKDIVAEKRTKPQKRKRKAKKEDDESSSGSEDEVSAELAASRSTEKEHLVVKQKPTEDLLEEPNLELGTGLRTIDFRTNNLFMVHHVRGLEDIVESEIYERISKRTETNSSNEKTSKFKQKLKKDGFDVGGVKITKKKGFHDLLLVSAPREKVDGMWELTTFESLKLCVAVIFGIYPEELASDKPKTAVGGSSGTLSDANMEVMFENLPNIIPEAMWTNAVSAWRKFKIWKDGRKPGAVNTTTSENITNTLEAQNLDQIKFRVSVAKGSGQKLRANFAAGVVKKFGWEPDLHDYSMDESLF